MKLNYTSLQHAVEPLEEGSRIRPRPRGCRLRCSRCTASCRAPRSRSRAGAGDARRLRADAPAARCPASCRTRSRTCSRAGLLAGHVTAGAGLGGGAEAITVEGALDAAVRRLDWDCALVGPARGSSARPPRSATAAWRRSPTRTRRCRSDARWRWCPRIPAATSASATAASATTPRPCCALLLRAGPRAGPGRPVTAVGRRPGAARSRTGRRMRVPLDVDELVEPYLSSGLPARTMGRTLDEDRDFFLAGLAGGALLADMMSTRSGAAMMSIRADRQRGRLRGTDRDGPGGEVQPRRRRGRRARGGRAPRRGGDAAAGRRSHLAGAPAARGGRRGRRCSSCRPGS